MNRSGRPLETVVQCISDVGSHRPGRGPEHIGHFRSKDSSRAEEKWSGWKHSPLFQKPQCFSHVLLWTNITTSQNLRQFNTVTNIQAGLASLRSASPSSSADTVALLHRRLLAGLRQLVFRSHCSNSSCSLCIARSHFANSIDTSNLTSTTCIMVASDQWFLMLPLSLEEGSDDGDHFLAGRY